MSVCTCRTSGDKRSSDTPVLSSPAPQVLCRGLSCERRVEDSQQADSGASGNYAWQCCGLHFWLLVPKSTVFSPGKPVFGPGLAALFQPNVFISLPSAGLTSCRWGSQSFPRLIRSGKSITTSLLLQWLITSHYISLQHGMCRLPAFQLVCLVPYLLAESLLKDHIFWLNSPMMMSPLCCMWQILECPPVEKMVELLSAPASSSSCGCYSCRWCFWWPVYFPEGLSCLQTPQCYPPKDIVGAVGAWP